MREVAWITFHLVIALPLALILSVVLRELLRALLALATGFRVFEIRFGVGQKLHSVPFGPMDLSISNLPLGGATFASSGDAKRHRISRIALATAPLLAQFAWLLWTVGPGSANLASIQSGFAPITVFTVAQGALFVLHLFLPIQWGPGERTDIRAFIDVALGSAGEYRRARAAYYVRCARHAIERGRIADAHSSLQQGLTQLGPEPLLVECDTILSTRELTSVVDQGESAEAMLILLEWAPSASVVQDAPVGTFARLGRRGVYALPLALAAFAYAALHHDAIANTMTERWIDQGAEIAETGSASACAEHRTLAAKWPRRLAEGAAPAMRRDHHATSALLLACEGALQHAESLADEALTAAETARATHYVGLIEDPSGWLQDELRLVEILGLRGEFKLRAGTFRLALQNLERADRELALVREQLTQSATGEEFQHLAARIDAQTEEVMGRRRAIRTQMAGR